MGKRGAPKASLLKKELMAVEVRRAAIFLWERVEFHEDTLYTNTKTTKLIKSDIRWCTSLSITNNILFNNMWLSIVKHYLEKNRYCLS